VPFDHPTDRKNMSKGMNAGQKECFIADRHLVPLQEVPYVNRGIGLQVIAYAEIGLLTPLVYVLRSTNC